MSAAVLLPVFDCGAVEALFFMSAVGLMPVFANGVTGTVFFVPEDGDAAGLGFSPGLETAGFGSDAFVGAGFEGDDGEEAGFVPADEADVKRDGWGKPVSSGKRGAWVLRGLGAPNRAEGAGDFETAFWAGC